MEIILTRPLLFLLFRFPCPCPPIIPALMHMDIMLIPAMIILTRLLIMTGLKLMVLGNHLNVAGLGDYTETVNLPFTFKYYGH